MGTASALPWMSSRATPCCSESRRAVRSCSAELSIPVTDAPLRAIHADTYAVPHPSSIARIPVMSSGSMRSSFSGMPHSTPAGLGLFPRALTGLDPFMRHAVPVLTIDSDMFREFAHGGTLSLWLGTKSLSRAARAFGSGSHSEPRGVRSRAWSRKIPSQPTRLTTARSSRTNSFASWSILTSRRYDDAPCPSEQRDGDTLRLPAAPAHRCGRTRSGHPRPSGHVAACAAACR